MELAAIPGMLSVTQPPLLIRYFTGIFVMAEEALFFIEIFTGVALLNAQLATNGLSILIICRSLNT